MNRVVIIEQEQIVITRIKQTIIDLDDVEQPETDTLEELTPEEKLLQAIFGRVEVDPDSVVVGECDGEPCLAYDGVGDAEARDEALTDLFANELTTFDDCPEVDGLSRRDISSEQYREYDNGNKVYRISDPVALYYRQGGLTHRVVDARGVTHCVPFPSDGSVALRWENRDRDVPVNF